MFGRRSIPSGGVARPFHTRSMRSPRALPDRHLSTQTWEVILARTLTPKYMTCETGRQQSPINITMAHHGHHSKTLVFHYQRSELHEMNNGHTIQVSHTSGCHIDLDNRTYQLRQVHFHEPSEHHIDGHAFPMEMHLVHQNERSHILVIFWSSPLC